MGWHQEGEEHMIQMTMNLVELLLNTLLQHMLDADGEDEEDHNRHHIATCSLLSSTRS